MLIAPIDHNREPEPEKHVSKIKSPYWTLPTNGGLGAPQLTGTPHNSEGIILRVRDTRLMERRKNLPPPKSLERERRIKANRKSDSRWNAVSHHVLIIALERKAGEPEPWKTGDRVSVSLKPSSTTDLPQTPTDIQKDKSPLLTKDDEDYVLHLSGKYPKEY